MERLTSNNIIGDSNEIKHVLKLISRYSQYPTPVLITGETGTGKELVARGLHYTGPYADKPFITVNCSTFTDSLFTSELFGYKKGAFTDAKQNQKGLIEEAEGGTLFLDEIDSLSLKSQAGLLRLLQENEYRPVGGYSNCTANVRIVAAANCKFSDLINNHHFREDLYYRLDILKIHLPPLRERKQDIAKLTQFFLAKMHKKYTLGEKTLSSSLFQHIHDYTWPGNIRELENTLHRIYLTTENNLLDMDAILMEQLNIDCHTNEYGNEPVGHDRYSNNGLNVIPMIDTELNFNLAKQRAIENFESNFVLKIMAQAKGNVSVAASLCGKERSALGKLVKKHNLRHLHKPQTLCN